jgi:hypothetical protein
MIFGEKIKLKVYVQNQHDFVSDMYYDFFCVFFMNY